MEIRISDLEALNVHYDDVIEAILSKQKALEKKIKKLKKKKKKGKK